MRTLELKGLTFSVNIEPDCDADAPWVREDSHGIVSDWTRRDKTPGERVLCDDRGSFRYYNFAETIKLAARDGWGLPDDARADLARKLGREPTAREVTAEAVEHDFKRLRGWCRDDWGYAGVVVTLLDVDGNATDESDAVYGIESDAKAYFDEVARDLAEGIAERVGDAPELVKRARIRKA